MGTRKVQQKNAFPRSPTTHDIGLVLDGDVFSDLAERPEGDNPDAEVLGVVEGLLEELEELGELGTEVAQGESIEDAVEGVDANLPNGSVVVGGSAPKPSEELWPLPGREHREEGARNGAMRSAVLRTLNHCE